MVPVKEQMQAHKFMLVAPDNILRFNTSPRTTVLTTSSFTDVAYVAFYMYGLRVK